MEQVQAGRSRRLSHPVSSWDETQVFTLTKKREGSVLVEERRTAANVHGHTEQEGKNKLWQPQRTWRQSVCTFAVPPNDLIRITLNETQQTQSVSVRERECVRAHAAKQGCK